MRKDRAARLRARGDLARSAFMTAQLGRTATVLFEKDGLGRTPNFAGVRRLDGQRPDPGTMQTLRMVDLNDGILMGVPL